MNSLSKLKSFPSKLPNNYWNSVHNQKKFLDDLFRKLELRCMEDWYCVTQSQIKEYGGSTLLKKYGSLNNALVNIYPAQKWDFCRKKTLPKHFWSETENHKRFLDSLIEKLKLTQLKQILSVPINKINQLGGDKLLQQYNNNLFSALVHLYPDEIWEITETPKSSVDMNQIANQKLFLDSLYKKFGFNSLDDWYNVSRNKIISEGGSSLIRKYENEYQLFKRVYPDHSWDAERFISKKKIIEKSELHDQERQRSLVEEIFRVKKFTHYTDWNSMTKREFKMLGGSELLKCYSGNLSLMLRTLYPHISWDFLKIQRRASSDSNFKSSILKIIHMYKIEKQEHWYRVSLRMAARETETPYEGDQFVNMLKKVYPDHSWNKSISSRNKKSEQRLIFSFLTREFSTFFMIEDYKPQNLLYSDSRVPVELDIFIPAFNIALEYQGQQHYDDIPKAFNPYEMYKKRDDEKIKLLTKGGISLFSIPYWLNAPKNLEQMVGIIYKQIHRQVLSQ